MSRTPSELTILLKPENRVDVIDVSGLVASAEPEFFQSFRRTAYLSYHTTAGYFEQQFCNRLKNDPEVLEAYVSSFRRLFPQGADYSHDRMDLRNELSDSQKLVEPRNADSHLTYIGSGLENCVTYVNREDSPVFFVDLDGTNGAARRDRRTTLIGYNTETVTDRTRMPVSMSGHPIDAVNLWDPRVGFLDQLQERVEMLGITKGRIDLSLSTAERQSGLTVNEYETLLMTHDLVDVLRNPIWFMAQKGRNMLRDPRAIKEKAKDYAKYDLVHVVNEFIEKMGLSESLIERIIDKFFAVPAERFLRMKRSVSLVVSDADRDGQGQILTGTYQSPILVQWAKADRDVRRVDVSFTRFE
jgi:thiamine phosphate synthase YjbQ (UPF0047 family)